MRISGELADNRILEELGSRLADKRLELEMTQMALAEQAGVSRRTIERLEAGASAQTLTLIRVLRVLNLTEILDQLIPSSEPRPLDLLKLKGKKRQRASTPRSTAKKAKSENWTWNDKR